MEIVVDHPPIYDELCQAFPIAGKPMIFAWGGRIFNPHCIAVPPILVAHEAVHGMRQGSDIEGWWRRYIDDPAFRLDEEVRGHLAEYEYLLRTNGYPNRNARRRALRATAKRLASPVYRYRTTTAQAERLLKTAPLDGGAIYPRRDT